MYDYQQYCVLPYLLSSTTTVRPDSSDVDQGGGVGFWAWCREVESRLPAVEQIDTYRFRTYLSMLYFHHSRVASRADWQIANVVLDRNGRRPPGRGKNPDFLVYLVHIVCLRPREARPERASLRMHFLVRPILNSPHSWSEPS